MLLYSCKLKQTEWNIIIEMSEMQIENKSPKRLYKKRNLDKKQARKKAVPGRTARKRLEKG